ncbi:23S rRNA (uracil(1939)-C(5))-methyltransferase RlmD [Clostridium akagii]|uniref:23S rRNA (uracil(1939)-C(5))-methyltransferase RlmD n=1 Tax=Clostridium akagii TaxID=91623 RepID=UPI00047A7239|nr:23S rRNA (uracil(1939)-C(5))-methyltransferase RlmD [Clostridium akagii]
MKKNVPVLKNETYTINIDAHGYEGEGIGRIEDFTIFVKNAIAGEQVQTQILKVNKNFAFGKIIKIIKKSENRDQPICPIYNKCGGCNLQHLKYRAQLDFKKKRVEDCIERIGKLKIVSLGYDGINIHETIGMENPYRYRNKAQLPISNLGGEAVIGFYSPRSHDIIPMEHCYIQCEAFDDIIKLVKTWINKYNISTYDEKNGQGILRHLMVRKSFRTGEVMVVIVVNSNELPHSDELIHVLTENISDVKSVIQNINKKATNVILGQKCITLFGQDKIVDTIDGYSFDISPLSFFQVNPKQTEILYKKVLEYANLSGNEIVFDAYCGTGTISLFLSQKAKKVYGVEIIKEAIDNAKANAIENKIKNTEFIVGEAEEVIPQLINKGINAEVVVVDPPRKGCAQSLLEAIASMKPNRIVYVSCDPGTLARDLSILDGLGYETIEIQPVDMFPQTSHVENVVKIVRK